MAVSAVLSDDESKIENNPSKHAGSQFHETLDINVSTAWYSDPWVELAANVPIIYDVARSSSCSELAAVWIVGLDCEGSNIDVCGQSVRNQDVCSEKGDVVPGDEGPQGKVRSLNEGAGSCNGENEHGRGEGWVVLVECNRMVA